MLAVLAQSRPVIALHFHYLITRGGRRSEDMREGKKQERAQSQPGEVRKGDFGMSS
jgi:hypothetical protein